MTIRAPTSGGADGQIADMLGCSVGTVKSNASRALGKLRTMFAAHNLDGSDV